MSTQLPARLRAARHAAGFKTLVQLCEKHNLQMSNYSKHETGAVTPRNHILKKYSEIFEVSYDWLKHGKGLPYDGDINDLKNSQLLQEVHAFKKVLETTKLKLSQPLLHKIVEETIAKLNIMEKRIEPEKIADLVVGVYVDIASREGNEEVQLLMVPSAVSSSLRFL